MSVYYTTIFAVLILGILESQAAASDALNYDEYGCWYRRRNNFYVFALVAIFLFVGGCRYKVGADYMSYFVGWKMPLQTIINRFLTYNEPGIPLITLVCRNVWDEGAFVIFVENAIIVFLIFYGLKKSNIESYTIPLLLYIFFCGWLFSFNGIRQAMAASIVFAFSTKTDRRWLLKSIVVVLVAGLFHKSAVFMLPFLIISRRKIDFKQIIIIGFSVFAISYFGNFALEFMETTVDATNAYLNREINPIRVIVSFAPLSLILLSNGYRDDEFWKENSFVTNMTIINALITYMTANSAYMNRFSKFTVLYTMLFLPKYTGRWSMNSRRLLNTVIILLYFGYFLYEVNNSGTYLPFQWSFYHLGEY